MHRLGHFNTGKAWAGTCFDWSSQGVAEEGPVTPGLKPPGRGDGGLQGGPGLGDEPRMGPLGVDQVHVVH